MGLASCTQILMLKSYNFDNRALSATTAERASLACELLLQGKWKLQILSFMCSGPVRLGQLARLIPGASKKVITQNLRKLEADGVVVRSDFSDVVLHVEYDLSPNFRDSVANLLDQLGKWGSQYVLWSTTTAQVATQASEISNVSVVSARKPRVSTARARRRIATGQLPEGYVRVNTIDIAINPSSNGHKA